MQAVALLARQRTGKKGGVHAVALRYRPYGVEKRYVMVCGGDGLGTVKIDLILSGTPLMMAAFRTDVHLFQRQHDIPADILAPVHGGDVHIAALVMWLQRGTAAVVQIQQVKLAVRADANLQPRSLAWRAAVRRSARPSIQKGSPPGVSRSHRRRHTRPDWGLQGSMQSVPGSGRSSRLPPGAQAQPGTAVASMATPLSIAGAS